MSGRGHEEGTARRFQTLPSEIIVDIFEFCLPSKTTRQETPLHLLPPFTLSWVCKSWRQICLASPTLWTDVRLGQKGSDPEGDARLLELALERSAHLPVTLSLIYEVDDTGNPVIFDDTRREAYFNGVERLLDVALSNIHRWRVFEIHVLDIVVLWRLFSAIVIGAPQLEKLSLSTKYLAFFGDFHIIDFSLCPKLLSVCLSSPLITPSSNSTPMNHLTTLELMFCTSVEDCLQWLDLCPNIERLTMRLFCTRPDFLGEEIGFNWTANGRSAGIRQVPRLLSLDIVGFSSEADMRSLLNVLDVPNLRSFACNMYDLVEQTAWTPVLDLLRRSQPPLEKFKLSGTPMEEANLISCLRFLPGLKKLIIGQKLPGELLRSLTFSGQSELSSDKQVLCPSLEEINLVDGSYPIALLEEMVASRCLFRERLDRENQSTLKRLLVAPRVLFKVTAAHGIAASRDQGLEVESREPDNLIQAISTPDVVFV